MDIVEHELAILVGQAHMLALALLAAVVAIPIFMLTGLGLVALTTALGAEGTLAAALSIGWFVIFIGSTTVAVAWIVRRLRPVTRKVEGLADPSPLEAGRITSVENLAASNGPPAPPPAGATGDPAITDEVRRWTEQHHR